MDDNLRAGIAFIAIRVLTTYKDDSIYDFSLKKFHLFSGTIDNTKVDIYNYTRNCYISGNNNSKKYSLYDYGFSSFIDFEFDNVSVFKGYDYKSASFYEGKIKNSGKEIEIYDFGTGKFYFYSV